jgi:hypothetical protein
VKQADKKDAFARHVSYPMEIDLNLEMFGDFIRTPQNTKKRLKTQKNAHSLQNDVDRANLRRTRGTPP